MKHCPLHVRLSSIRSKLERGLTSLGKTTEAAGMRRFPRAKIAQRRRFRIEPTDEEETKLNALNDPRMKKKEGE
jgi:hypothetical protein